MNVKLLLASLAAILGISGVVFAQNFNIGNPFASLGIEFYGFFLPWIFTFAIVYGLLSKMSLFSQKNINMALSFVVAFFVTATGGAQLAGFFTALFGGASIFLAGILVILLFAMMVGVNLSGQDDKHGTRNMLVLGVVVLLGIVLFLGSSGNFIAISFIGPDLAGMLFWIVIIIAAIYFVMEDKGGSTKTKGE